MPGPTIDFPEDYAASRRRFRESLGTIRERWPDAGLDAYVLAGTDLTIDWIAAEPRGTHRHLLLVSAGQHGVEGFCGSAVLQLFLETWLDRLDASDTGLLLIHAINPWGMKHSRHTNAAAVDLNRNFLNNPEGFDPSFNPDYLHLDPVLNPRRPITSLAHSRRSLLAGILAGILRLGPGRLRTAVLLGQYRNPRGIYYGGTSHQEETRAVIELYRRFLPCYDHFVQIDVHTGYGPRDQMTLINSIDEPRSSEDLKKRFDYPAVAKADRREFYSIRGDMIDFVYHLVRTEYPGKQLYATSFEFGTLGASLSANLRSLQSEILENQLHWYGCPDPEARRWIQREFRELFAPLDPCWLHKAAADAQKAFQGILSAEGMVTA